METASVVGDPANRVPRLVLVPRQDERRPATVAVVDAPSALAGFLLVMSLPGYRCRNVQGADSQWRVSVELRDDDSLSVLTDAVGRWLRRARITATELRVGEDVHRLTSTEPRSGPRG
jgi:hypothetical protein